MASIHELAREGSLTKAQAREAKKRINEPDADGVRPLALAARYVHLETVEILLGEGADPNLKDGNGITALNIAAHYGSENQAAIIRALLEAGAHVDATDQKLGNNTPLMTVIIQTRDLSSISELLNKGASLSAKNSAGETAADLAAGDSEILAALRKRSGGMNLFLMAVRKFTKVVLAILSLLNKPLQSGARFLTQVFHYTPQDRSRRVDMKEPAAMSEETAEETPETGHEREVQEQLDQLSDEIKKPNLDKFTGMDDNFLETLIERTKALRADINTDLGQPKNLTDMINLSWSPPASSPPPAKRKKQRVVLTRISKSADWLDDIFDTQRENERALEVWLLKTLVEPIYRWGPDFVRKQRQEKR
ncbi:hypothetical protein VTH06DRAFT_4808 [Thermothelomyces fergusii]